MGLSGTTPPGMNAWGRRWSRPQHSSKTAGHDRTPWREFLWLLVPHSKYWLIFGVCDCRRYQTTEELLKTRGGTLEPRRLFRSASALVCIWELKGLYYGYIENILKLTCKESRPCSIWGRTAREEPWLHSGPSKADAHRGRRNASCQTEHFGSGNAPSHPIFGTKPENKLICAFSDNPKPEMNLFCVLPEV